MSCYWTTCKAIKRMGSVEEKAADSVTCRFVTQLPAELQVADDEYAIPTMATRLELSQLVNTLIGRSRPLAFDFLVNGSFMHTTLGDHLLLNEISSEQALTIEYILAQLPPSDKYTLKVSDWVSTIIPSMNEYFTLPEDIKDAALASLYDGSLVLFNFTNQDQADGSDGTGELVGVRHQVCKLFSTPIKATCLVKFNDQMHIAAGGYEGRILCSAISETDAVFTQEVEYTNSNSPILSLASNTSLSYMAAGTVDGFVHLYNIANTQLPTKPAAVQAEPRPKRKRLHGNTIIKTATETVSFSFHSAQTSEARAHNPFTVATDINSITFSNEHNSPYIAAGCGDNCIRFYDIKKNAPAGLISTNSSCQVLKYMKMSDDMLLCGFNNKLLRLYDTRKDKPLVLTFTGHKSSLTCLDVRDDMIISGSIGGDLCIWDPRSSVPLWIADCFYRKLEHKRDQSRLLSCAFAVNASAPVFYHGGSDRQITMRKITDPFTFLRK
ncbi:Transducin [Giardia lamblia P15]|uniref:Transducin n=1 Tax=Giardia intestinalis (strain P15) TaxID=658858 RepID=E1F214_GIAIA|nr:Transducin [Giardia lamblia P15]